MTIEKAVLEQNAVEMKDLSTNYFDVATGCDCMFDDAVAKAELMNQFPLVTKLLSTRASQIIRGRFNRNYVNQLDTSTWELKLPTQVWTEPPKNTGEECCWQSFDFAKCCGTVPMNLLCLKECGSVFDELVKRDVKVTDRQSLPGIANAGETQEAVERRIAKLSFAFFQAYTAILGLDNTYTDILKPFHGLLSVMENPAVMHMYCVDILSTFESLGCRIDALSGTNTNFFIATHPVTYRAISNAVFKGQDGDYPRGWSNNPLTFHGIPFVQDVHFPVDITNGTGEAWLIDGNTTGLFMASDLFVGNDFIKGSGVDTSVDGCGTECTYYYNYGAAFGMDANKLAVIADIPLDTACVNALGGLEGFINPTTLIPNGAVDSE